MIGRSILVTGASGMLGGALVRAWRHDNLITAISRQRIVPGAETVIGDLTTPGVAASLVEQTRPELVVHAAAWTDVDGCEADPVTARRINAEATGRLAEAAQSSGAAFVYISTAAVFDGKRGGYREEDPSNPVNQYGFSKLAGERATLNAHHRALVLRIDLEGWRPGRPGFVHWIIEGLRCGKTRKVCTDWIHTVIFASNVANVIEGLWVGDACGVYHAGAEQPASNWEVAQAVASEFELDRTLLVPITSESLRLTTIRPKNTSLVSSRLTQAIGSVVSDLGTGLTRMRLEESGKTVRERAAT